jgi:hypothetical protein
VKEVEGKEVEKGTRRRGEGEEVESDIWIYGYVLN